MAGNKVKYIIDADISDFVNAMITASTSAKRADKDIQDSFRKTDISAKRLAGSMKASFLKFDSSLGRSTGLVRDWGVAMRSVNTTTLILGATAAAGAILGLAGATGQAIGILYTLPAAVVGVGSILGAFAVGFSGIGAAVKELDKANVGAAGSSAELMKQLSGFDKMNVLQDKSVGGGGGGGAALNEALAGLSPAGQAVAKALYDIGQRFKENIGKPVQEVMLKDVAPALYATYEVLEGPLKNALINVAGAANLFLLEMLRVAREPFFGAFIEQAGALGAFILTVLRPALEPLTRGFIALFQVSTPYIEAFTQGLSNAIVRWGNWMDSAEGRNAVKKSIDESLVALRVLGDLIGAIGGVFSAIFDAAGEAIYKPVIAITQLINRFEAYLRTAAGIAFINNLLDISANAITALGDVIATIGSAFAGLVGWFASLSNEQQQLIIKVGIFIGLLGGLISFVGGLISPLVAVAGAVGTFITSLGGGAAGATGLAAGLAGLRTALGVLTGPVGWIITALTLMFANSESLREAIGGLISSGLSLLVTVFKALMAILEPVFKIVGVIAGVLGDVLGAVLKSLKPIIDLVIAAFNNMMKILQPILDIVNTLATLWGSVFNVVFETLTSILEELFGSGFDPLQAYLEVMGPIVDTLAASFKGVADWIKTTTQNLMLVLNALGLGKSATEGMTDATGSVKDAQERYNDSVSKGIGLQKELKEMEESSVDAKLAVMDAQDRLKQKQDAYNTAVATYGPKSREAERASLELQSAQYKLTTAQEKATKAGDDLKNKQGEVSGNMQETGRNADDLSNRQMALKRAQDASAGAAQGLRESLASSVKGGVNAVIRTFNNFSIPPVIIMGKEVTPRINFPDIPYLAKGGIVNSPTMAMIGEAGQEAVMPLENNTGWIDKLASKINSSNGGTGGQPIQLVVQIGEEKVVDKVIQLINEKTQMSGQNTILV